ncbi:hypothetical protein Tco_1274562 [Tanacetum coccineum]
MVSSTTVLMSDVIPVVVISGDIHAPGILFIMVLTGKNLDEIISALKARTLLSHGCEGFLATIHDTTSDVSSIHDQPIVSEFQDVFPEELPGIPPIRDVEFNIELIPGAEPISKAPYRMAPIELKELKDHYRNLTTGANYMPSFKSANFGIELRWHFWEIVSGRRIYYWIGEGGFQIYSDASKKGLGCVLMQHGKRRWLELLKDYDTNIQYHLGKANVVADALSRKSGMIARHQAQKDDGGIWAFIKNIDKRRVSCVMAMAFFGQWVRRDLPRSTSNHFWWSGMKGAMWVRLCQSVLICQQVKIEHQRCKWIYCKPVRDSCMEAGTKISLDFVTVTRTQRKHDAIWVLVDRLTNRVRDDWVIMKGRQSPGKRLKEAQDSSDELRRRHRRALDF